MNVNIRSLTCIAIILLALLNYYPVLNNDFALDDSFYTDQIIHIHNITDLPKIFNLKFSEADYRPVATLTFALEKLTFGEIIPGISHGINLIIYIVSCLLFYILLSQLPSDSKNPRIASITAILFTILPLHASMLGNIKNRDGILSFLFGLLFIYTIIQIARASNIRSRIIYLISGFTFLVLSIYSKLDGFIFLIAIPIFTVIYYQKINWKSVLKFIILIALSYRLFNFMFSLWMDSKNALVTDKNTYDPIIYTENPVISLTDIFNRLSLAIQTVFEYVLMIFKPSGHYFYYGYDTLPVMPLFSPLVLFKLSILILIVVAGLLFYRVNKLFTLGVFSFFISLAYCSNLITPVSGIVADRYAFIASAGACLAAATLIITAADRFFPEKGPQSKLNKPNISQLLKTYKIEKALLLLVILIYLPFNITRSKEWYNIFTLIEADLPKIGDRSYEANRIAMKNYIELAYETPDETQRTAYFDKGLSAAQNAIRIYDEGILTHEGVIMAYFGKGDMQAAFDKSKEVIARFDTSEVAWRITTEVYAQRGQLDAAAKGYKRLSELVPGDPNTYFFYTNTLQQAGRTNEALAFCDSLIRVNPDNYIPYQAKAYLYFLAKDSLTGSIQAEKAFELGGRDNTLLDAAGFYWGPRDQAKYESLKQYIQR